MADIRSVPVLRASSLCLLMGVLAYNVAATSSGVRTGARGPSSTSFGCHQVRELFEGNFGSPASLHAHPQQENDTSLCSRGSRHSHHHHQQQQQQHLSCCSADTEAQLAAAAEKRLKEKVRSQNHALKKHLNNILSRYQDRQDRLLSEAQNRTGSFLSGLHGIPGAQHGPAVASFFTGLQRALGSGQVDGGLDEVVRDFFTHLFPPVFNYVLTVRGQGDQADQADPDHHDCLQRYAEQVQPFGNAPDRLLRQLRRSAKHASGFQGSVRTFIDTLTSIEAVSLETSCQHALLRLQVCPTCRGVNLGTPAVKPCRGMCLNVMRGCLAKLSEVSSSWDDLVVAFENLQVGMLGQHDLQKLLLYLDVNVSEAIMMAMDDSPRIYDEVRIKCPNVARDGPGSGPESPVRPAPAAVPEGTASRSRQVLQEFRQEVRSLVKYLEDSKGVLNRLPDSLCQDVAVYDQDLTANRCWNGSTVGSYKEEIPEANFLSQVQHNKEVKVSLMDPDFQFLQVKESLTHTRRNLNSLLNADIMMADSPQAMAYRKVATEGSGYTRRKDVIIDDEDWVPYGSGSGSGSGDDQEEGEVTSKPVDITTRKPTRPVTPSGSAQATTSLAALLTCVLLCALLDRLH